MSVIFAPGVNNELAAITLQALRRSNRSRLHSFINAYVSIQWLSACLHLLASWGTAGRIGGPHAVASRSSSPNLALSSKYDSVELLTSHRMEKPDHMGRSNEKFLLTGTRKTPPEAESVKSLKKNSGHHRLLHPRRFVLPIEVLWMNIDLLRSRFGPSVH